MIFPTKLYESKTGTNENFIDMLPGPISAVVSITITRNKESENNVKASGVSYMYDAILSSLLGCVYILLKSKISGLDKVIFSTEWHVSFQIFV